MAKGNPKTMRFDSEIEEYINTWAGNNFTDRFDTMVRFFAFSEQEKKKKIEELDEQIEDRLKRLKDVNDKLSNFTWVERSFKSLEKSIEDAQNSLKYLTK